MLTNLRIDRGNVDVQNLDVILDGEAVEDMACKNSTGRLAAAQGKPYCPNSVSRKRALRGPFRIGDVHCSAKETGAAS